MRIDIGEAEGKLSELVGKVVFGGENQIILTKHGNPVARITDYYDPPRGVKIGTAKGLFTAPSIEELDSMNDEITEMFGVESSPCK